jgi:hypothetical protein
MRSLRNGRRKVRTMTFRFKPLSCGTNITFIARGSCSVVQSVGGNDAVDGGVRAQTCRVYRTRCIRSFQFMSVTWEHLASKAVDPGYAAFGRRQADTYRALGDDAEKLFAQHGEERFVKPVTTFVEAVIAFRREELAWFEQLQIPVREEPTV